jgi:hypothetical protein
MRRVTAKLHPVTSQQIQKIRAAVTQREREIDSRGDRERDRSR